MRAQNIGIYYSKDTCFGGSESGGPLQGVLNYRDLDYCNPRDSTGIYKKNPRNSIIRTFY